MVSSCPMTPEQFTYWLQGFLEVRGTDDAISPEQTKVIREHLAKVLVHVPAAELVPRPTTTAPSFCLPGLIC